jgi:hypothetical protein
MSKHFKFLAGYAISLLFLLPIFSHASPLEEELQKLREAGIPTTIEELNLPDIPDEENAKFLYEKAEQLQGALFKKHRELWNYFPSWGYAMSWDEVPVEKKKQVVDYLLNDAEFNRLCDMLEKAAKMQCLFFSKDVLPENELSETTLMRNTFAYFRGFARTLSDKARIEAEYGDIDKALKAILTGFRLSDSLFNEPRVIPVLVHIAADVITMECLQEVIQKSSFKNSKKIAGDLLFYKQIMENISRKRNSRRMINQLITGLIFDAREAFPIYKRMGETMFQLSEFEKKMIESIRWQEEHRKELKEKIGEEEYQKLYGSTMLKTPTAEEVERQYKQSKELLKADFLKSGLADVTEFLAQQEVLYLNLLNRIIPVFQRPYYEAKDELNKSFEEIEKEIEGKYTLRSISNPLAIRSMLNPYLRHKSLAGMGEIGLANIIYKQKHGEFADSLNQLAPEILPVLPHDPFTGKDYIYRKTDTGFTVYSVGENLTDDGGIDRYSKEGREKGSTDIVWRIN